MKIFWLSGCFFLLVALRCTNGNDSIKREKRQSNLALRTESVAPTKETYLFLNEERVISLTGSSSSSRSIISGQVVCNFVSNLFSTRSLGTDTTISQPIQNCYDVDSTGTLKTYTQGSTTTFGFTGQVYIDQNSIVYIDSAFRGLIAFVQQQIKNAPPVIEPITVLVVPQNQELLLNIDNTNALNDNIPDATDDVLTLTTSFCRNLQSGGTFIYGGMNQVVTIFDGAAVDMSIANIEECSVIQNINGCPNLTRLRLTPSGNVAGPGLLCHGESALSSSVRVCFFSNNQAINNMILTSLVQEQMSFLNVTSSTTGMLVGGRIVGQLGSNSGRTLIDITTNNTQYLSFPTASRIQYMNGAVTVFDSFGNVLRQIGSTGSPATLAYYNNTRLDYVDTGDTFNVPVVSNNGLNVVITGSASPMVFAYPGGDSVIQTSVDNLRTTIPTAPPTTLSYSVSSTTFGTITLLANNREVQTVSTDMSVFVELGQCAIYDMDVVNIYNNCDDTSTPVNRFSDITTLNVDDAQANRLISYTGSAPSPIQGPGRFYFSGNSGFYTARPEVMQLILNAETFGARSTVNIMRRTDSMNNDVASLTSGNSVLFTFDMMNTSTIDVNSNDAVLYRNGQVGLATSVLVPEGATVQFINENTALIQGGPGPDRNVSIRGPIFVQQNFPGNDMYVAVTTPSERFPGGGILYTGDMGTVYNRDRRSSDALYNRVNAVGGIRDSFPSDNLNYFNGRTIQMFNRSADTVLLGPGRIYTNTRAGQSFFTTDSTLINRIPSVVSQLVPLSITYSTVTGDVNISTSGGMPVTSISVSSESTSVPTGNVLVAESGMITLIDNLNNSRTVGTNIDTVTILDGISAMNVTITGTDPIILPVPGTLFVDMTAGRAVYSVIPTVTMQISDTISNAFFTFGRPIIPRPSVPEVTSTMSTVDVSIGQGVTVPAQSTVRIQCTAGNANPPATFEFSQRDSTNESIFTSLEGAPNVMTVVNGPNDVTFEISNVEVGDTEYRCSASNILGEMSRFTRVTGIPGRAPEIRDGFFTGGTTPGTIAGTARTDNPTSMPIIGDVTIVDDTSQLTDRVIIGCRAKGRPVPSITWRTMPPNLLNFTSPDYNVSFLPGQSILSVALAENDLTCVTYICNATNGLGSQEATRRICPQIFSRDSMSLGTCSETCGIGVQEVMYDYQQTNAAGTVTIPFDDIPQGLIKPEIRFCATNVDCPEVSVEYQVTDYLDCSEFCGVGRETRNVTCIRRVGANVTALDDTDCFNMGLVKPQSAQNCNIFPCPVYSTSEFGDCTRTCRGGMMSRTVGCLMVDFDENGTFSVEQMSAVDFEICLNYSREAQPPETVPCNSNIRCPVSFLASFNEPCDEFNCQEIFYSCFFTDEVQPWPTNDDGICRDQGLVPGSPVMSCGGGICNFGYWNSSSLPGEICSAECGHGFLKMEVSCLNRTSDEVINDRYCNGNLRPNSLQSCFIRRNCPGVCSYEPPECEFIALFNGCKRGDIFAVIPACCKSCPIQATAIPSL